MFEEQTIAFRAILLYEYKEGAAAAKAILDRVCAAVPNAATPQISPWRFDHLRDLLVAQSARSGATEADVIVVAARGTEPLPLQVKQALENWAVGNVASSCGFIVLLTDVPDSEKTESPVHRYIKELSARTDRDFFSRGLRSTCQQSQYTKVQMEEALADQEFMAMSVPTRRWGIND